MTDRDAEPHTQQQAEQRPADKIYPPLGHAAPAGPAAGGAPPRPTAPPVTQGQRGGMLTVIAGLLMAVAMVLPWWVMFMAPNESLGLLSLTPGEADKLQKKSREMDEELLSKRDWLEKYQPVLQERANALNERMMRERTAPETIRFRIWGWETPHGIICLVVGLVFLAVNRLSVGGRSEWLQRNPAALPVISGALAGVVLATCGVWWTAAPTVRVLDISGMRLDLGWYAAALGGLLGLLCSAAALARTQPASG